MGNTKSKDKKATEGAVVEEIITAKTTGNQESAPGMIKAKKYDWKDSNLALFGSDTDKGVKKASAETEPAWKDAKDASSPCLFVWRIEKFKVVEWAKDDYGKFYSGDSYIILNIKKENDQLLYDVHFWIGKRSTQDEYGTAAYKTVELDTLLDDKAVQHREVQGFESDLFKSYFPVITIMKGGCASGFRHVKPEEYQPRLLHFHCRDQRHCEVKEVKLSKQSLNSGDVFILDLGKEAFQWNGKLCNKNEKVRSAQFLQQLESERNGRCKTEVFEEADLSDEHRFYKGLPDVPVAPKTKKDFEMTKTLYRLSDEAGKLTFSIVSEGKVPKSMLSDSDVFIIDNGKHMFVYIGEKSSDEEKKNAMVYAHNYLKDTNHPMIGITCLRQGQHSKEFDMIMD